MKTNLDHDMEQLRNLPIDSRLDQLEPAVWQRVGVLRRDLSIGGVWGWRAALAVLMLTAGILTDGAATAKVAHEVSPFAVHSTLAPSTLLEGRS